MSPRAKNRRAQDPDTAGLTGTWYRCAEHGLSEDVVFLAEFAYCAHPDCSKHVTLAHSVLDDLQRKEPRDWNKGPLAARAPRTVAKEDAAGLQEVSPTRGSRRSQRKPRPNPDPADVPAAPSAAPAVAEPPRPILAPAVIPTAPEPVQVAPQPIATDFVSDNGEDEDLFEAGCMPTPRPACPRPKKAARAPREAPAAPVRGATPPAAGEVGIISAEDAAPWWTCAVCERRRRGAHVAIAAEDLVVAVCAPCAAGGDAEMRAAAAPILVRSRRSA